MCLCYNLIEWEAFHTAVQLGADSGPRLGQWYAGVTSEVACNRNSDLVMLRLLTELLSKGGRLVGRGVACSD
jgi:hypothetical protein